MASPLVEQFRKGGVSRDVRATAAAGLLPLKPTDQVELLYLLTRDGDGEIRERAVSSLMGVGAEELNAVLKDRATNPKVLQFYGTRLDNAELLKLIVQNPSAEDQTITDVVSAFGVELLEIVVINQTRLIRHPPLIAALEANPNLNSDQRRRLNELKHDFKLGPETVAPPVPSQPEPVGFLNLDEGPPENEAPPATNLDEVIEIYGDSGEGKKIDLTQEEQESQRSIYERLLSMNAAQKMVEALKGDREMRMILIRDRNRIVYSAVLSSPKLTDGDVEAIAQMRNISPEVLREIGRKREWSKRYPVRLELVKNPLTPIEISMRQISNLSAMDLKKLARDRNVPEQVRRQAQKLTQTSR